MSRVRAGTVPGKKTWQWLAAVCLMLVASLALAIVRITDPGGDVAANQSVTITLPGGETREAETDDDGILFWLLGDGSRGAKVESLEPGTTLSGGLQYANLAGGGGLFTPTNAVIGALVVAGGVAIASDGGSDNDPPATDPGGSSSGGDGSSSGGDGSSSSSSGGDGSSGSSGGQPPPEPAQLAASPAALSLDRTVGDTPCPAPMGDVEVSNTGEGDMTYTVSQVPANFAHDAMPTTLGAGQMENFQVDYLCDPDQEGTVTGTLTIEGTDEASGDSAGTATVELTVNNSAPAQEPGFLSVDDTFHSGDHDPDSTPCDRPEFESVFTNTGDQPLTFMAESQASWITVSPSSGTLQPGESVTVKIRFNCGGSGFSFGQNNQTMVLVSAEDDMGNPVNNDAGSIEVEVFVEESDGM